MLKCISSFGLWGKLTEWGKTLLFLNLTGARTQYDVEGARTIYPLCTVRQEFKTDVEKDAPPGKGFSALEPGAIVVINEGLLILFPPWKRGGVWMPPPYAPMEDDMPNSPATLWNCRGPYPISAYETCGVNSGRDRTIM